jgi:hypothetical protein
VNRAYDLAWFWHVPPAVALALELPEFLRWEAHARRIAEWISGRAREV